MLLGVCALLASDSAIKRIFTGRQKVAVFDLTEGFPTVLPICDFRRDRLTTGSGSSIHLPQKNAKRTFTVRLASILIRLGQRRMGCFALLVAGRGGGRMDLLIAVVQRAAILNVGGQTVHNRWR